MTHPLDLLEPLTQPSDAEAHRLDDLPADLREVAEILEGDPKLRRRITHRQIIPPAEAQYADFPAALAEPIREVLRAKGIEQLYSHQSAAIQSVLGGERALSSCQDGEAGAGNRGGNHTCVVTPTASGKTLCYTLPILQSLLDDPESRALCLFPTKALSHDQLDGLLGLAQPLGRDIKIFSYDGDTPGTARRTIRQAGHIVVTNPDMLHAGILPHHTLWKRLFENLRWVVIDEVHTYRGVFGSHVANVLRRLQRLAAFYGARPTFICCSATIDNPRELCEELTGLPFQLVDESGAPRAAKLFYFMNPPVVNKELGIRRGAVKEAQQVATRFLAKGLQTIVFARSRMRVEILTQYLKRAMTRLHRDAGRIRGYRGGYLPNERRAIEAGIKSGEVLGVVSTNALELGVDIGQLRVCVMAGYPGTIASTWQQGGRAGRSDESAAVVMIASSSPLDQFIIQHPDYFFGTTPEQAIINPENISILASHIKCAAFELPFEERPQFGPHDVKPVLEYLEEEKILKRSDGRFYWAEQAYPAEDVSLRSPSPENFLVKDNSRGNKVIAEVDYDSAPLLIHEKAIYMHNGQTFHVDQLDWAKRMAFVRPVKTDYYTDALDKTDVRVLRIEEEIGPEGSASQAEPGMDSPVTVQWPVEAKRFGEVTVQTVVAKFKKVKFETHESIGYGDVHVPMQEIQTECFWLNFAPEFIEKSIGENSNSKSEDGTGLLVGLAHVLSNVLPLLVMCEPRDLRATAMIKAPHDQRPAIYIYDNYPGGIGLARRAFRREAELFQMAARLVADCPCTGRCPSCVGPALEEAGNLKLKQAVAALIAKIGGR